MRLFFRIEKPPLSKRFEIETSNHLWEFHWAPYCDGWYGKDKIWHKSNKYQLLHLVRRQGSWSYGGSKSWPSLKEAIMQLYISLVGGSIYCRMRNGNLFIFKFKSYKPLIKRTRKMLSWNPLNWFRNKSCKTWQTPVLTPVTLSSKLSKTSAPTNPSSSSKLTSEKPVKLKSTRKMSPKV